jgi:hypothetical protein
MNNPNQKTFTIKYKSPEGEVHEGTFTTKRLSIKDRSQIGMRKSQLAGGMYCVRNDDGIPTGQGIDEETDYLNGMIAHLETALIRKPAWFDLNEVADLGLVRDVYERVWDFESSFFRLGQEDQDAKEDKPDQVGGANGSSEHSGTGHGNDPTPVVDREVQAALDA